MQTKPAPVDSHRGIWCRRLSRGITVPERVWSLGVDNATSLERWCASLAPGWRLVRKKVSMADKNHPQRTQFPPQTPIEVLRPQPAPAPESGFLNI